MYVGLGEGKSRVLRRTSRCACFFLLVQADRFRLADRRKVLVLHRFGRREPLRVLVPEQAVDQVDRGVRDEVLVVCGEEERGSGPATQDHITHAVPERARNMLMTRRRALTNRK